MSRSEKDFNVSVSSPVMAATVVNTITSDVVVVDSSNVDVTLKTEITSTVEA